jgi:hypothetical protein
MVYYTMSGRPDVELSFSSFSVLAYCILHTQPLPTARGGVLENLFPTFNVIDSASRRL